MVKDITKHLHADPDQLKWTQMFEGIDPSKTRSDGILGDLFGGRSSTISKDPHTLLTEFSKQITFDGDEVRDIRGMGSKHGLFEDALKRAEEGNVSRDFKTKYKAHYKEQADLIKKFNKHLNATEEQIRLTYDQPIERIHNQIDKLVEGIGHLRDHEGEMNKGMADRIAATFGDKAKVTESAGGMASKLEIEIGGKRINLINKEGKFDHTELGNLEAEISEWRSGAVNQVRDAKDAALEKIKAAKGEIAKYEDRTANVGKKILGKSEESIARDMGKKSGQLGKVVEAGEKAVGKEAGMFASVMSNKMGKAVVGIGGAALAADGLRRIFGGSKEVDENGMPKSNMGNVVVGAGEAGIGVLGVYKALTHGGAGLGR